MHNNSPPINTNEDSSPGAMLMNDQKIIANTPHKSSKKFHFKFKHIMVVLILFSLLTTAYFLFQKNTPATSPQETQRSSSLAQASKDVFFPIFIPNNLPTNYTFDARSVTIVEEAVMYTVTTPSGATVNISVQARPADLDMNEFHEQRLFDPQKVETSLGGAYIGRFNNAEVGSQVTAQSWILARATVETPIDEIATILRSLERYQP